MKQTILSILLMLLPMVACADAVEINGIWYNLVTKGNVAEVTRNPSDGDYSGDIVIPEKIKSGGVEYSVTKIGDKAFYYSKKMKSVKIPKSVTSIGGSAFSGCSGLTSITIPQSVTSIGNYAFYDCSGLTSMTIGNSVTSIGDVAFYGCSGLTSITIPQSVTSIGVIAFSGCSGLTSVHITDLNAWCRIIFADSYSNPLFYAQHLHLDGVEIKNLVIPNNLTSISNYAFSGCSGLTSITIPQSVTSIGNYAFYGCSGLTSMTIGNSVTSIGNYAFYGCSGLTSITIPESVKFIHESAFGNCENITDVYCKPEQVRANSYGGTGLYTGTGAFSDSYPEYITLHVPSASIEAYRAIKPWSKFKDIVALEGGDIPETPKCATPIISVINDKISFSCATEGAEFISEVIVDDAKKYYDSEISLSKKYIVSVYATKTGYLNSDVATKEIEISGGSNEGSNNSGPTLQGDVNGDGKVDVADHVTLSGIIMAGVVNPSDDIIETDKITASFTGGAYIKLNDQIQSGSKLNVQLSNHSGKAITLTGLYLIDGQTKYEGSNLLSENVEIPAGADLAYTLTVGALGITKPIVRFIYSYKGKTYQVEGEWKD